MDLPTRDVIQYIKNGGRLPVTKYIRDYKKLMGRTNKEMLEETQNYCEGGILVFQYPGVPCNSGGSSSSRLNNKSLNGSNSLLNCFCLNPLNDPWSNKIHAIGGYGLDDRNFYYVYLPNNFNANSKIVVLIHGGGLITGPDPEQVNGWGSTYTVGGNSIVTNQQNQNLVKNLLSQGYVVVSLLYRLVQYGDNNTDIVANTVSINDQIDDVEDAIEHIHTNFPTCLGINANNIQILGESAGAHLALMYSYTRANTSYVKSVVSVAGPTNMSQMANWMMNKPHTFVCGNDFVIDNPNITTLTHFPFYGIYDPVQNANNYIMTALVNPLNCTVANIRAGLFIIIHQASSNTQKRVTDSYRLAQSCVQQIIANPSTHSAFQNISPCSTLVATRIVPTFIIHGTDDWFVPYKFSTNTLHSRLNTIGGLIDSCNSTGKSLLGNNSPSLNKTIPTSYNNSAPWHLIKTYTGWNHDVSNAGPSASTIPTTTNGQSLVQLDILTWFNGH